MASAFMAIFGALGGGALRLLPLLIDAWQKRKSTSNEVELAKIALEQKRAELDGAVALAQAKGSTADSETQAAIESTRAQTALVAQQTAFIAQQAQAKSSGVGWVDALNVLVRPAITMWLLLLYTTYKVDMLAIAFIQHTPFADIAGLIWTDDDITIFAGTVTFWFVDQTLSPTFRPTKPPAPPKH
jgi:hypothetical protein